MELLKIIFFTTGFFTLSTGAFFNIMLYYLFINLIYKTKPTLNISDPVMIFFNLLNILIHLIYNQMIKLVNIAKKNKSGSIIINSYTYLNNQVVRIKNILVKWIILIPMKYVMKKTFNNLLNEEPKTNKITELKNNQDIMNFLDRLSNKNK